MIEAVLCIAPASMIMTALTGALAPATGSLKPDAERDEFPVFWIAAFIVRMDWHYLHSSGSMCLTVIELKREAKGSGNCWPK